MWRRLTGRALAVAALLTCAWPRIARAQFPPPQPAPPTAAPSASSPGQQPVPPSYTPGYAPPGYPPSAYPPPGYAAPPGYPAGYAPPPGYARPYYAYAPPGPEILDYVESEPVPAGYHVERRIRRGAALAGAIIAGSTYAFNVIGAALVEEREWLWVPIVGGWPYTPELCETTALRCGFLLVHNTTHTVGVLLAIYGIAARHDVLVRNDVSLWVAPTSAGSAVGVAANF